ncbi:MAG: hypothetical protein IT580_14590 [Verrucomicrobiales bacterium]|nr:hypothetical protein [Verrucomicrobiales bacterium]
MIWLLGPGWAAAQTVQYTRKANGEIWLEGNLPATETHVLQSSPNLRFWVDVRDGLTGHFSLRADLEGMEKRFFRVVPSSEEGAPITLAMVGDSTVADLASNSGVFSGWGQGMHGYFKAQVRVINLAMPCYGTKTFLASAERTSLEVIRPDVVLVQFGMIDEIGCGGDRSEQFVATETEYRENLKVLVEMIRGFGGQPVLVTPPVMRRFNALGRVITILPNRRAIMQTVATELQVPLVDLYQMSGALVERLGLEGSAYLYSSAGDLGHFSLRGAEILAGMVISGLPPALGRYVVADYDLMAAP